MMTKTKSVQLMSLMLAALVHTTLATEQEWWARCPKGTKVRISLKKHPTTGIVEGMSGSDPSKVKVFDGVKCIKYAPDRLSLMEGTQFELTGLTEKYNGKKGTIAKWFMLQLYGICQHCNRNPEAQKKCTPCDGTGFKQQQQDPKVTTSYMEGGSTDYYKVKMNDFKIDSKMKKDNFFKDPMGVTRRCRECGGKGTIGDSKCECKKCNGFGQIYTRGYCWVEKKYLKVFIPKTSPPPQKYSSPTSPRLQKLGRARGDLGRRRLSFSGRRLLARERRLRRLMSCM